MKRMSEENEKSKIKNDLSNLEEKDSFDEVIFKMFE